MPFAIDLLTPKERIMRAAKSSLQRLLHPSPPSKSLHFLWSFRHPNRAGRKGGRSLASTEHFKALSKSLGTWVYHSPATNSVSGTSLGGHFPSLDISSSPKEVLLLTYVPIFPSFSKVLNDFRKSSVLHI